MHEYGIIKQITDSIQTECRKKNITEVSDFTLFVSKHSGFHSDHIAECFKMIQKENPMFLKTKIFIEEKESYAKCNYCQNRFMMESDIALCPTCGMVGVPEVASPIVLGKVQVNYTDKK